MEKIFKKLNELLTLSYAPYSKCNVACVLDFGSKLAFGVNVENASYGLSMCAERSAVFNAVSLGLNFKDLKCIYIKANKLNHFLPCGACLQVLSEFASRDVSVVILNCDNEVKQFKFYELLPQAFSGENLK